MENQLLRLGFRGRYASMYTHARQFPHLAKMSDLEIRELAHNAMSKRPILCAIIRFRNVAIFGGMILLTVALQRLAGWGIGAALMLSGGLATAIVLSWNVVWVNTILFRITKIELVDRSANHFQSL